MTMMKTRLPGIRLYHRYSNAIYGLAIDSLYYVTVSMIGHESGVPQKRVSH